ERGLGEKLFPRPTFSGDNEFVGAESFLVEEEASSQAERGIKITVRALWGERNWVDPERLQQPSRHIAVRPRTVNRESAAVHKGHTAPELELVALGVAAEIVVIVENENAGGSPLCAEEICSRQSADACADDHKVVSFVRGPVAGLARLPGRIWRRVGPEIAVAQPVRGFVTPHVIPAQPGKRRRVVSWRVLWRPAVGESCRYELGQQPARDGSADGKSDTIEKVASRDRTVRACGMAVCM